MIGINQKQISENTEHWKKVIDSVVDYYQALLAGKTLEQSRETHGSLPDSAHDYVGCAFKLLVGERYDLANDALDHAIKAAEEALRIEDFYIPPRTRLAPGAVPGAPGSMIDDETYKPTPEEIHKAKFGAKMMATYWLHYALWLKNGERPLDLWRKYVEMRRGFYRPVDHSGYDNDPVAKAEVEHMESPELRIMLELAELGDHDEVIRIYKNYRNALKELPKDARFNRHAEHVLYVLSEYALGREVLKPLARGGIDYWYARSLNWTKKMTRSPWWTRMGWAYLRGKYFTGVTNSRVLIKELRGY